MGGLVEPSKPRDVSPDLQPPFPCPGDIDPMGCMMPEICVAEGEECPFFCPHMPPMDCGEGMITCPGDIDPMGCMMPEICMAEGDECPFFCPHIPPTDCGEGM